MAQKFNSDKYFKHKTLYANLLDFVQPSMNSSPEKIDAFVNALEDMLENYSVDTVH